MNKEIKEMTKDEYRKNHILCDACNHYREGVCSIRYTSQIVKSRLCADNSNCYYKQLKKVEQELENCANFLTDAEMKNIKLQEQVDELNISNKDN